MRLPSTSIPSSLHADALPEPMVAELCTLCRGDWSDHKAVARTRWDDEHRFDESEPGATMPPVTVLPVDCIVVLRRAAQGPPGPPGAMGPMGNTGLQGERGYPGRDASEGPADHRPAY